LAHALDGKVTVNGDTVKLTGNVWVEKALTVPEGITLDLTTDEVRLFLKDGATLTVNGTVNARGHGDFGRGWVEGSLSIEDGATVINGSGTIYLKGKGRLLSLWSGDGNKRHLALDGVTMVGVGDNSEPLVTVEAGSELVLKSGAITGNTCIHRGGGVNVQGSATFIIEGGTISGNVVNDFGAGVVIEDGRFNKTGGVIYGHETTVTEADRNIKVTNVADSTSVCYYYTDVYGVFSFYHCSGTLGATVNGNISTDILPSRGTGYNWTKH
jgi:hypothetical protein